MRLSSGDGSVMGGCEWVGVAAEACFGMRRLFSQRTGATQPDATHGGERQDRAQRIIKRELRIGSGKAARRSGRPKGYPADWPSGHRRDVAAP